MLFVLAAAAGLVFNTPIAIPTAPLAASLTGVRATPVAMAAKKPADTSGKFGFNILKFLVDPGDDMKAPSTVDTRKRGAAPETIAARPLQTSSWSPAFKFDKRSVKTAPKKTIGNTFPNKLMPKKKK